ncbi:protease inhibitor I9 family protein [Actinokineospora soli]|uniref:Protease inhibitor I9 family protein n=1 Tax=Actinokineospora soli TaxID=1048753 RepID=A0ABW2TJS3_9PSEU
MRIRTRLACVGVATGGMIAGLVASAGAAEGQVLGAGAATAIEGSYVVVLKPGAALQDVPGTVTRTYRSALRGFAVTMSERQARRLAADPAVAYVEQDQVVTAAGEQLNPPSWGTDRVDQRTLPWTGSTRTRTRRPT